MFFNSGKMALRAYRAQIVSREQAPELYDIVDRLRQRAGLPMPALAIAPHEQPNAFATGRSPEHAVVCVTEGLTRLVDRDELEGVLAHELGHIKNRDMLLQTVSATMAGAITNLSRFGMVAGAGRSPLADGAARGARSRPSAAMIIQFAISRSREFKADATGAEISGKPLALASALGKLQAAASRIPMQVSPTMAPLGAGQSAVGLSRRHRLALLDAPLDRGADRAAAGDCARRSAPLMRSRVPGTCASADISSRTKAAGGRSGDLDLPAWR